MSHYGVSGEKPVARAVIAVSCVSILGALVLLGLSIASRPAHPVTRGTRIAWALTMLATLTLISSHIIPLMTAIRVFLDPEDERTKDFGPATLTLQGLTLIFEIVACRSIFYATIPLGSTQWEKRRLIILDMISFVLLVGTFIGALAGADYRWGMCFHPCISAGEIASLLFFNTNMSAGMLMVSIFSFLVVLAGAISGAKWSPHSPLAQSLRVSLSLFAAIQILVTGTAFFYAVSNYNYDVWDRHDFSRLYYATIPFWLVEISGLWLLQLALRRKPTGVLSIGETGNDVALNEQVTGRAESHVTA